MLQASLAIFALASLALILASNPAHPPRPGVVPLPGSSSEGVESEPAPASAPHPPRLNVSAAPPSWRVVSDGPDPRLRQNRTLLEGFPTLMSLFSLPSNVVLSQVEPEGRLYVPSHSA